MIIIYAIPSGNRVKNLSECISAWRKASDFKIAITTWDDETEKIMETVKPDYFFRTEIMRSYGFNHNNMAKDIEDWEVYICGADDLFPEEGIEYIQEVASKFPDKLIWVRDGLFNAQMTHPIITKGWYRKHGRIFEESYRHNFVDTDLFIRAGTCGEIVRCFQIGFDHRHFLKTNKEPDEIYMIGNNSYSSDEKMFRKRYGYQMPPMIVKNFEI